MDERKRGVIGIIKRILMKKVRGIFEIKSKLCKGKEKI